MGLCSWCFLSIDSLPLIASGKTLWFGAAFLFEAFHWGSSARELSDFPSILQSELNLKRWMNLSRAAN